KANRIPLPDAPGNRARWSGVLPNLRDGAGTKNRGCGARRESRTGFDDAPFLGERGADDPGSFSGNVRHDLREPAGLADFDAHRGMGRAVAVNTGGAVGRV